ncbi:MAG: Rieske (2Fe-2S) protein [Labilithrix sp.]|nr:Rieske (2Fe-2S) protein [Labilithrix sp.]
MAKELPIAPPRIEGSTALVVHEGVPYCIVKTRSGEICAFVAACAHEDRAIVPLRVKRGDIVCPHHGARFDAETGRVSDDRGYDVPTGLESVEVLTRPDGSRAILVRKRHRKLLSKKERRRVAKESASRT